MKAEPLFYNDTVSIIYEACTACYNNTKPLTYEEKKEYITKRINAGHSSILEHGFVSMLITEVKPKEIECLTQLIGPGRYLNIFISQLEDDTYSIMIGGSIRAYRHLIENIDDFENEIFTHIMHILRQTTVKEFYPEYCPGLEYFVDIPVSMYSLNNINQCEHAIVEDNELFKIFDILDIEYLDNMCNKCFENGFYPEEFYLMIPVTVLFKNMSRTATHQLVRHRNAITQESQRYVDYTKSGFTIPDMSGYIKDYETKKFKIKLDGEEEKEMTLSELKDVLLSIYPQLVAQGMKKEDARAFLPSNVQCGRLYMTFSLWSLTKFLELRTDSHAQSEIRKYAVGIKKCMYDYHTEWSNEIKWSKLGDIYNHNDE